MPRIITSLHDPIAITATCKRLPQSPPEEGILCLDDREAFGWIVHLPKPRFPITCNTLTAIIAYHLRDNRFGPNGHIIRFIYRCYGTQALRRRASASTVLA